MPKISVIIPTYNCARYITEAIESVLHQTYKDLEIIVVDDGSTDNTGEVLKPYIERNIVKYIYQENQGPGAARNTGIISACGDYIAFLDSDDIFTAESLEKRFQFVESHPEVGLVFSNCFIITETPRQTILNKVPLPDDPRFMIKTSKGIIFDGPFQELLEVYFKICTITVLINRQVFKRLGFFRTDIRGAEDTDMWLRISKEYKIGYVDSPLAYYNHFRSYLTVAEPLKFCLYKLNFFKNLLNTHHKERKICRSINKRIALAYYDIGFHYYERGLRMKFLLNFMKGVYYEPFGAFDQIYRHFVSSLVPRRMKLLFKKLSGRNSVSC